MTRQPKRDLRRRQRRKKKVHYLQDRLRKTKDPQERDRLINKLQKISPGAAIPEA